MQIIEYGKRVFFTFLGIGLALIILTLGYYFNFIGGRIFEILYFIVFLIFIFCNSFILGKKAKKRGFLEGIKLAFIICLIFLSFSLIIREFNLFMLVYYLIIFITAILGSMIGISKKKS